MMNSRLLKYTGRTLRSGMFSDAGSGMSFQSVQAEASGVSFFEMLVLLADVSMARFAMSNDRQ